MNKQCGIPPTVALLGPRQAEKTTLAQTITKSRSALYLDLENPEDLLKLSDPSAFLPLHSDKLVIVDEIQCFSDLFMVLRGLINKNRRAGRKGGQYLLLGPASMDLLQQSSESLTGRISYIELSGLNLLEVPSANPEDIHKLWLRGGFPESYLAETDPISTQHTETIIADHHFFYYFHIAVFIADCIAFHAKNRLYKKFHWYFSSFMPRIA